MKNVIPLLIVFLLLSSCKKEKEEGFTVDKLTCEYLVNPIGIDAVSPRLSWQLLDRRNGTIQNAFQILVGTDILVLRGRARFGIVARSVPTRILPRYSGKELNPHTRYYWGVEAWDNNDIFYGFRNCIL
ncbi:MAG: hypothetical protein U5K79_22935 [Cyclobacteriaceae bacterium]|nr:hypothetical protein [Cyclobacteriaceae bacterium]